MYFYRKIIVFCVIMLVSHSVLVGRDSIDDIISLIGTRSSGVFLCNSEKMDAREMVVLLEDNKLLGWDTIVLTFDGTPIHIIKVNIELSWQPDDHWAFFNQGHIVASGTTLPSTDDLKAFFVQADIPNRIAYLRRFIILNPNNLDAKLALMQELYIYAHRRTAKLLGMSGNDFASDPSLMMSGTTLAQSTQNRFLTPEDDLRIWGEITSLIGLFFDSNEWISILPEFFHRRLSDNMAFYSPLLKGTYKKYLPYLEGELVTRQTDTGLWNMWLEFAQVLGRRALDFFQDFSPLPKGTNYPWPPVNVHYWMAQELFASNNWREYIDIMWPSWPSIKLSMNTFAPVGIQSPLSSQEAISLQLDYFWGQFIFPLLKVCLNQKDVEKVDEIYLDISSRPVFANKTRFAIELAKTHNYVLPDVLAQSNRKSELNVYSFIGDPTVGDFFRSKKSFNCIEDFCAPGYFSLLVITPFDALPDDAGADENDSPESEPSHSESTQTDTSNTIAIHSDVATADKPPYGSSLGNFSNSNPAPDIPAEQVMQYIRSLLVLDKLPEYGINLTDILKPDHPLARSVIHREGLSENTFNWGIVDDSGTYYHGGNSMPTVNSIIFVFDSIGKNSRLQNFREFLKHNPQSVTAKSILLFELLRIGNIRTKNASLDEVGFLNSSDDLDIWGEFIRIATDLIPRLLSRPDNIPVALLKLPFVHNSRLLQLFASRNVDLIEYALLNRPHSRKLWELWAEFSPTSPKRPLPLLLASLTPVLGLPDFPPASIYPSLITSYQSLHAWGKVIAVVEPIWESFKNLIDAGENIKHLLTPDLWQLYINPLCEAYENIGQDQKSKNIRLTWSSQLHPPTEEDGVAVNRKAE